MTSAIFLLLLSSSLQARSPHETEATVSIRVTDRAGRPLESAHVVVDGISERQGNTNGTGTVRFLSVVAGGYKLRVERGAFITLVKDFTVTPGSRSVSVVAALSPDPHASARSFAASTSLTNPRSVSIPDIAEKQFRGKQSVEEAPIGCSGATAARLIQVRESVTDTSVTADEMLYVVAGEGTLTFGGQERAVKSGWFTIVPRGTTRSLQRKGRNPVIVISVLGGQPCAAPVLTRAAR
jgi:mannose-6-phosphate isomerase-like protein (cupin superfamily)